MKAPKKQIAKFKKAAREVGCSEDEAVFDATLKKIGSYKPGAPMAKEPKTSTELNKLLHEQVKRSSVGRIPNPQWIKIVPLVDDKRANWKVAHSPKTEPPGDYWKAIERVMPELQKLYDLKE